MLRSRIRRLTGAKEDGQALVIFAGAFVIFLGFIAMSIDVGRLMWARAQIQAAADAASLAGAAKMADGEAAAETEATTFWNLDNDFLESQGENLTFSVTFPGGNRAVQTTASVDIPTWFAKFFGVNDWHLTATSKAESVSLDIAVVLDVSGSMCFTSYDPTEGDGSYWTGYVMSPGRKTLSGSPLVDRTASGAVFPKLTTAIAAGGADSITIYVNDRSVFTSTSSSTNATNFGNSWNSTTPYWQRDPDGGSNDEGVTTRARSGMIMIDSELFKITGVPSSPTNALTVSRARVNKNTGVTTAKAAHAVDAEIWTLHGSGTSSSSSTPAYCDKAAYNARAWPTTGPHQPFDDAMQNAKDFVARFDETYDKVGVSSFSTSASSHLGLSSSWSTVNSTINGLAYPQGGTNIAHGLAVGRLISTGTGARANATKVVVLLTDGAPNYYCTGGYSSTSCSTASSTFLDACPASSTTARTHAVSQAAVLAAQGIRLFVIGLGADALPCVLSEIAAAGNGTYYSALTTEDLDEIFEEIAETVRVKLTA